MKKRNIVAVCLIFLMAFTNFVHAEETATPATTVNPIVLAESEEPVTSLPEEDPQGETIITGDTPIVETTNGTEESVPALVTDNPISQKKITFVNTHTGASREDVINDVNETLGFRNVDSDGYYIKFFSLNVGKNYLIGWAKSSDYKYVNKDKIFLVNTKISDVFPDGLTGNEKLYAVFAPIGLGTTTGGKVYINKDYTDQLTLPSCAIKESSGFGDDTASEKKVTAFYDENDDRVAVALTSSFSWDDDRLAIFSYINKGGILTNSSFDYDNNRPNDNYTYVDLKVELDPRLEVVDVMRNVSFISYAFRPHMVLDGEYNVLKPASELAHFANEAGPTSTFDFNTNGKKTFILRTVLRSAKVADVTAENLTEDMYLHGGHAGNVYVEEAMAKKIAEGAEPPLVVKGSIGGNVRAGGLNFSMSGIPSVNKVVLNFAKQPVPPTPIVLPLEGDLLVNNDTQHNAVYVAGKSDTLQLQGDLYVKAIQDRLVQLETAHNIDANKYPLILVNGTDFEMTAELTLPNELVFGPTPVTANLSGSNDFEVRNVAAAGQTVTVTMGLKNPSAIRNYGDIRAVVMGVANGKLSLNLSGVKFAASAVADTDYKVVGNVSGSFTADATLGTSNIPFQFAFVGKQWANGSDFTDNNLDHISLTLKQRALVVPPVSQPNNPKPRIVPNTSVK